MPPSFAPPSPPGLTEQEASALRRSMAFLREVDGPVGACRRTEHVVLGWRVVTELQIVSSQKSSWAVSAHFLAPGRTPKDWDWKHLGAIVAAMDVPGEAIFPVWSETNPSSIDFRWDEVDRTD